jgi:DNA topoisomerase-1
VKRGSDFRSLASDAAVFEVGLDEAVELFRQEKPSRRGGRKVLRELGSHPESGAGVQLLEGRYGPYVTDGTTNASLPKDANADEVTLDRALELLKEREGAPKSGRGRKAATRGSGTTRRATTRRPAARKRQA